MDTLEVIRARRSISRLVEPGPDAHALTTILEAAASAPDHGSLRPWRFVILAGDARAAFGEVLEAAYVAGCEADGTVPVEAKRVKDRTKLQRAPVVVVVGVAHQPSDKIPVVEQFASGAAAAQNACLAATALGYGSMWRTGPAAYDPSVKTALGLQAHDDIVGYLYLGTVADGRAKPPQAPDLDGLVTHWTPPSSETGIAKQRRATLPADDRPVDPTPVHTADLPATPIRDRNIPAVAWQEAPDELLRLGDDIGRPPIAFKRRIGPWLLWRAGPAAKADARYLAVHADDLTRRHAFRLHPDGRGEGAGPSGATHQRFRSWKEDLRDHG
ncbi:hypothetical protein BH20ACT2_BH20ACT2_19560 [soil metagenome]